MKICSKCKVPKEKAEFSKGSGRLDGLDPRCKECEAGRHKKHRDKNPPTPAQTRIRHLRVAYGLSLSAFEDLLSKQGGKCAICAKLFSSNKHRHIDHCHVTKKIRGILCANCNRGLGNFEDSPEVLRAAIGYLALDNPSKSAI